MSEWTTTIYSSPPMAIGKHEWRARVFTRPERPPCLTYEWRYRSPPSWPQDDWCDYHKWPRYDFNDGTYAGCPRSLVRLRQRHENDIKAALASVEA